MSIATQRPIQNRMVIANSKKKDEVALDSLWKTTLVETQDCVSAILTRSNSMWLFLVSKININDRIFEFVDDIIVNITEKLHTMSKVEFYGYLDKFCTRWNCKGD